MNYFNVFVWAGVASVCVMGCVTSPKIVKPTVEETVLLDDNNCSIKLSFDGKLSTAKEIENAYNYLYSNWSVVRFAEDWEIPVLEQATFPKALSAEKDRLVKFNRIIFDVRIAAESPNQNKNILKIKDYKLGAGCKEYVGGNKNAWARCITELDTIFPSSEREAAFNKVIVSKSEPYDCEDT